MLNMLFFVGCAAVPPPLAAGEGSAVAGFTPLVKTRDEWRKLLSPERFEILFDEGTERAGASPLNDQKREGAYLCAACFLPLFSSQDKFNSGTGWPSFSKSIAGRLETKHDYRLFTPRTEYHCARCGGYQGHVFDDGPPPTGTRRTPSATGTIAAAAGATAASRKSGAPTPVIRKAAALPTPPCQ